MIRKEKVLRVLMAVTLGAMSLQGATLEIYRDGAIYRYIPVDEYVGFLSRAKAVCSDSVIALERRGSCPESKRLCKEKASLLKLEGELRATQETLQTLDRIEGAIKPTDLSADKWISAAEKAGKRKAQLQEEQERLQRDVKAWRERFRRQSSGSEALFLSRPCKQELALTLPAGMIRTDLENEAEILKGDEIRVIHYMSLSNRSGVDIAVKDARIYARNFRRNLRPIRFSPWVVRPRPKLSKSRSKRLMAVGSYAADTVPNAPAPKVEGVQRLEARNYAIGKLDLPSTGEKVRVKLSEYRTKMNCETVSYPYRSPVAYRACSFQPRQEIVTDRWVLKQGRRLLAENAYGEYEDGKYLLYTDRDDSITIRRVRLPEKDRSSGIFGGEIRKKDGILLEVQNRSKEKKSLKIVERIPYSSTDKIEVKLLKVEGAKRESLGEYGKLVFRVDLAPGEGKKVKILFELRYDKDLKIVY